MLSLIACTMAFQSQPITLPAGYYTLSELSAEVTRQGVRIRADGECAGDVYAISADHVPWQDLRAALQEDDRLVFVDTGGDARIERSAKDKSVASATLARYLAAVATPIHAMYEEAAQACRKLQAVPAKDRLNVASTEQISSDTAAKDMATTWAAGNLPFSTIYFASALSSPAAPRFSRLVEATLDKEPAMGAPDGLLRHVEAPGFDASKLTDSQLADFARSCQIAGRLSFDPITFAAKCFTMGYSMNPSVPIIGMGIEEVSPQRVHIEPDPKAILDQASFTALATRDAATKKLMSMPEFEAQANLGERPIAASAALLRWAVTTHTNIVGYVPSFTDYVLSAQRSASLAKVFEEINANRIDADWLAAVARERVGGDAQLARLKALHLGPTLTASRKSGVVVVRNELRFLDGLCVSPAGVPTAVDNKVLNGQIPSVDEVIDHILSLPISRWPSSFFSSGYLRFCNPVAFRPFAVVLRKSPALRERLRQLDSGKRISVPLPDVEPAAREALKAAIVECAPYADGDCAWGDAVMMSNLLRDNDGRNPKIEMRNEGGRFSFRFVQYDESPWSAWIQNVRVR